MTITTFNFCIVDGILNCGRVLDRRLGEHFESSQLVKGAAGKDGVQGCPLVAVKNYSASQVKLAAYTLCYPRESHDATSLHENVDNKRCGCAVTRSAPEMARNK